MNPPTIELPICYRLAPDRRLLDEKCAVNGCTQRFAMPGEKTNGEVIHHIPPCLQGLQHHTVTGYDGIRRVALMVTPESRGDFRDQVWEAMSTMRAILRQQDEPMAVTVQTVFVDSAANVPTAWKMFHAYHADHMPLTLFVVQPPCDGKKIAIEAWAIGTSRAKVEYHAPHLVTVTHDGLRWIHASADSLIQCAGAAYEQSAEAFDRLSKVLGKAGASFKDVVRTWLYQGSITEPEGETERYRELNRARSDFFADIPFHARRLCGPNSHAIYPASTGIGTLGNGLVTTCLALQTERDDVQLKALDQAILRQDAEVLARHGIALRRSCDDVGFRHGEHRQFRERPPWRRRKADGAGADEH
jgi:enamine deaminase RidA (YjgF/YER057c/UK114 family)